MIRFLQTPGPVKKFVLGGMLVVICGAMLVYLIPSSGTSSTGSSGVPTVATVDGTEITADEVHKAAQQMAQQQAQRYGAQANMIMPFLMQQATQQAADQLVTRQVLLDQAGRMGLRVTPREIQDELQHGRYSATFFPGGNFIGETEYEDMLSRANLTAATFEDSVGKDIVIAKLQALVASGASVSEAEVRKEFNKENTKVKFDYAVIKQDDLRKGIHPTDAELQAFYDSHKASYANSIPEKRKIKYAVLDISKVRDKVQISREELQNYYDAHRDSYRVPEQIRVSHIWIKSPLPGEDGKVDSKAMAAAQQRAEDLLKQLKGGAKFEDVAKKSSEDPGSANVGGSLGWIGKGQTTPEFEKAAYALSKGQMSDVVKSSDGFHIIRLDDKHEARLKTLDEVKAQIEPLLKQQKAAQEGQKEADALLAQAKAVGLDAAAAAEKIPVITSDFFGRKDLLPGLGQAAQFMDAVFTSTDKSGPAMAATSQGFAVFEVLAIKPPATPTFDEIRGRVTTEFENERAGLLLSQKTKELSDRAKSEHDLKRAAKELGAEMKTSDFVLPDGQVPDLGSMSGQAAVAFDMKPGEISGPISSGNNGVVLELLEVQAPTDADYAAKRDEIRESLLQYRQQQLFGIYITSLKDEMKKSGKIKINEQEIKTLAKGGNEEGT